MGGSDSAANGAPHKNSTNTHIYSIDHHRNTMGRNEEHQRHRTRKDYGQRPDDVLGGEAGKVTCRLCVVGVDNSCFETYLLQDNE